MLDRQCDCDEEPRRVGLEYVGRPGTSCAHRISRPYCFSPWRLIHTARWPHSVSPHDIHEHPQLVPLSSIVHRRTRNPSLILHPRSSSPRFYSENPRSPLALPAPAPSSSLLSQEPHPPCRFRLKTKHRNHLFSAPPSRIHPRFYKYQPPLELHSKVARGHAHQKPEGAAGLYIDARFRAERARSRMLRWNDRFPATIGHHRDRACP